MLWFEADLYDQLQLAQTLDRLGGLGVAPERITLICIGEYLGIARFGGLGELRPDQLADLPAAAAVTLTDDALDLAGRAWAALRARRGPTSATRGPSRRSSAWGGATCRCSRSAPASSMATRPSW